MSFIVPNTPEEYTKFLLQGKTPEHIIRHLGSEKVKEWILLNWDWIHNTLIKSIVIKQGVIFGDFVRIDFHGKGTDGREIAIAIFNDENHFEFFWKLATMYTK